MGTMQEKGQICAAMMIFCQIYMNKRANMHKHTLENKDSGLHIDHPMQPRTLITGKGLFDQKIKMHGLELKVRPA